ncbi:MAG: type II toxin-antitoxin system VapC family toxin [Burkholderiales bacterium]|nr:type II toxin-antitoxin system VapC family toxin [Burkholderiales bacterium]
MIGVDTNVLVRYFSDDDPKQAPRAAQFIERELRPDRRGFVSLVTLAEVVWVLRSRYEARADELTGLLTQMLCDPRLCLQDEDAVWLALDLFQQDGVDLADALIAAVHRRHGCEHTMTFDTRAARIPGMKLLS